MNGYGALNFDDVMLLEAALNMAGAKGTLSFLEIGVHDGETAQGVKKFCDARKIELSYTGIDIKKPNPCPSFEGAKFIQGESEYVFAKTEFQYDIIFIDACHCLNHVMLDILNYNEKVGWKGYMLFHDTSMYVQGKVPDHHGPVELHCRVRDAMAKIGWPFNGFKLIAETFRQEHTFGGMQLYWREP